MTDPNVTYKRAYQELREELGRHPTANELLPLHESYKRAWAPAEETVLAPSTQVRAREDQEALYDAYSEGQAAATEPLSGPDKPPKPPERRSTPAAAPVNSGASEPPLVVASAPCRGCGREFERPARRGRPPVRCETCR